MTLKRITLFLMTSLLCNITAEISDYRFDYRITPQVDIPLGSTTLFNHIASKLTKKRQPTPGEAYIISLTATEINTFDRRAIYHWSPTANDASDFFNSCGKVTPLLLAVPIIKNRRFKDLVTVSLMYSEAYILTRSITGTVKYTARRPRPYLYNPEVPMDEKVAQGKNATRSFFSGHTSNAFCSAVFTAKVFNDMYPESNIRFLVWGVTLSSATTTGILRYYAGQHYPSDIIVGAIVGSLLGYFVPVLHKQHTKRVSLALHTGELQELALQFRF